MIMNKLKMNLAFIALAFPLLLCAKTQRIEMEICHCGHKTPTELFVSVEAFFDDYNKELTIKFVQNREPVTVTIEVKSKEGYAVYRNLYMPHTNSSLSVPLENIPEGVYELTISDGKGTLIGEFVYEH